MLEQGTIALLQLFAAHMIRMSTFISTNKNILKFCTAARTPMVFALLISTKQSNHYTSLTSQQKGRLLNGYAFFRQKRGLPMWPSASAVVMCSPVGSASVMVCFFHFNSLNPALNTSEQRSNHIYPSRCAPESELVYLPRSLFARNLGSFDYY